jgi:hypothetical protein
MVDASNTLHTLQSTASQHHIACLLATILKACVLQAACKQMHLRL